MTWGLWGKQLKKAEMIDLMHHCIANQITGQNERIETRTVLDWRENAFDLGKNADHFCHWCWTKGKIITLSLPSLFKLH